MSSRWLLMALSVVVFSPGFLRAQAKPAEFNPFDPDSADSANHKMYEDIEILRRILDRKLDPLYPRTNYAQNLGGMMGGMGGGMMGMQGGMMGMQGGMMGMQGGMMGMQGGMMGMQGGMMGMTVWHQEICPTLEGVYLKGQGVVYTATLSSLQLPAKVTARSVKEARLAIIRQDSEWESVRRQIRNEKDEPKKPEASKPPKLTDVLLNVLAENGHHFAQLGENESLTLIITVREKSTSATTRKSAEIPAKTPSQPAIGGNPSSEIPHSSNFARDIELLGDLHMKQGRYEEAIKEYKKIVKMNPKAELYRKLVQGYLALEKFEDARGALDGAIELTKKGTEAKPTPASKPVAALPSKLIISAPKKLLDEAGKGKLSFEEFRRRASVETLRFADRRP